MWLCFWHFDLVTENIHQKQCTCIDVLNVKVFSLSNLNSMYSCQQRTDTWTLAVLCCTTSDEKMLCDKALVSSSGIHSSLQDIICTSVNQMIKNNMHMSAHLYTLYFHQQDSSHPSLHRLPVHWRAGGSYYICISKSRQHQTGEQYMIDMGMVTLACIICVENSDLLFMFICR